MLHITLQSWCSSNYLTSINTSLLIQLPYKQSTPQIQCNINSQDYHTGMPLGYQVIIEEELNLSRRPGPKWPHSGKERGESERTYGRYSWQFLKAFSPFVSSAHVRIRRVSTQLFVFTLLYLTVPNEIWFGPRCLSFISKTFNFPPKIQWRKQRQKICRG